MKVLECGGEQRQDTGRRKLRVPTSSYAQMAARRNYYARNREAVKLLNKMYRAGVRLTTAQCRDMVAKERSE